MNPVLEFTATAGHPVACRCKYVNPLLNPVLLCRQTVFIYGANLSKNFLAGIQISLICFLYIPPSTSNCFKSGRSLTFESLKEECANCDKIEPVLLCSDFNARMSDAIDYIENDEMYCKSANN